MLAFRSATRDDVPAILAMIADDTIARSRPSGSMEQHLATFDAIDADPRNELVIAERDGATVGTMQLTWIPYLTHGGRERLLIEAVRVHSSARGEGIGSELFRWAIDRARERGCVLVQLTTDKRRADAIRFYEALGFVATHEGMKLAL